MAKKKYEQVTTARGEALWPHLDTPELWEGKPVGLTLTMKFDQADTQALQAILMKKVEEAINSPEFADEKGKPKKWLAEPQIGMKETKDGDLVFKFRTLHEYQSNGKIIKRVVPMFDSQGKKISVNLGNGSTCRVAFTPVPYWKSSKNNGIALYLDGVQVIKLVERGSGASASAFGFGQEEGGYVADEDENPFDGSVDAGDQSGDF